MSWAEEQSWFGLEDFLFEEMQYAKDRFLLYNLWITKDGSEINLSRMTTSHIQNCINKCKREDWRVWALPYLENELNKRKKHVSKHSKLQT